MSVSAPRQSRVLCHRHCQCSSIQDQLDDVTKNTELQGIALNQLSSRCNKEQRKSTATTELQWKHVEDLAVEVHALRERVDERSSRCTKEIRTLSSKFKELESCSGTTSSLDPRQGSSARQRAHIHDAQLRYDINILSAKVDQQNAIIAELLEHRSDMEELHRRTEEFMTHSSDLFQYMRSRLEEQRKEQKECSHFYHPSPYRNLREEFLDCLPSDEHGRE
ncbi:hypothetical protein NLJ89_g5875 [Agrocybe chaxingu]|uniref:Uncharacterized protein n=1 Tax=Agrocybe chaxingu TaxID=84603 RepID=A0A9W8JZY4_9AGAR|nr:hypothetical protein NLJ89_g5875 [Agrocybe chaxingu]